MKSTINQLATKNIFTLPKFSGELQEHIRFVSKFAEENQELFRMVSKFNRENQEFIRGTSKIVRSLNLVRAGTEYKEYPSISETDLKKKRIHPMPFFLWMVYQSLVEKNPNKKIGHRLVRKEIEKNYNDYEGDYILKVTIEDNYFEILPSSYKPTKLKWDNLPVKLCQVKKKFNVKR